MQAIIVSGYYKYYNKSHVYYFGIPGILTLYIVNDAVLFNYDIDYDVDKASCTSGK